MAYASEYPVFYVTADLVVLTIRSGELCVLVVRRGGDPFAGQLALPGGFTMEGEDIETAAYRELEEEAGLGHDAVALEQLQTFGSPDRDPRYRVVSVAWLALGADLPDPVAGSDAAEAMFMPASRFVRPGRRARLAFDHNDILEVAVERAKAKIEYSGLAVNFVPQEFTIAQLREVYETIWGVELDKANFHRKVTGTPGFLRDTGRVAGGGRGRPAGLFVGDASARLSPPILRG